MLIKKSKAYIPMRSLQAQREAWQAQHEPILPNTSIGHVYFMLFVSILFALGTQRELVFLWNMG